MKCQHRGALVWIIAPQECNQTWDCVETAMGKEGGREGKRDGREEQNIPDLLLLIPLLNAFWTSIISARSTHLHCSLCPSAREELALVNDIFLHCAYCK